MQETGAASQIAHFACDFLDLGRLCRAGIKGYGGFTACMGTPEQHAAQLQLRECVDTNLLEMVAKDEEEKAAAKQTQNCVRNNLAHVFRFFALRWTLHGTTIAPARAHELTVVFGADVQVTFSAAACLLAVLSAWTRK